jgi:hypothetical protein
VKRSVAAYWVLSHFERRTTKKWEIEKYCKNPLMYPLKIALLTRRGGELGDGRAGNEKQKKFVLLLRAQQKHPVQ